MGEYHCDSFTELMLPPNESVDSNQMHSTHAMLVSDAVRTGIGRSLLLRRGVQ